MGGRILVRRRRRVGAAVVDLSPGAPRHAGADPCTGRTGARVPDAVRYRGSRGRSRGDLARLRARLGALRDDPLPLADPHPTGEVRIASASPPERFERSVERAVELIRAGELDKVVLAREVVVDAPRAHDAAALYGALREQFPSCFCVCCGSSDAAFLAASPELLVRRAGAGATTVALAGSTRRSADPSVDDHLGEQLLRSAKDRREHEIVVRRIERTLRPHSVWVEAAPEPGLVKVANIQHLATPIHAQLVGAALGRRAGRRSSIRRRPSGASLAIGRSR